MAKVHPPMSVAVVEVADDAVDLYTSQGWRVADSQKDEATPAPKRRRSTKTEDEKSD